MLGRMALWDGGRGFGVDREEQAAAIKRKNELVRIQLHIYSINSLEICFHNTFGLVKLDWTRVIVYRGVGQLGKTAEPN